MYKILKIIVSALFIMPILISCKGDGKFISIGEPRFISEFPNTGELQKIDDFNCNEIGLRSIKVIDTLLFIDRASSWTIYSLDGKRKYGECMRIGRGSGEFSYYVPWVSSCHFFHENDSLFVYAPEKYRGYIYELNISELLENGNSIPRIAIETDRIQSTSWAITPCGKGRILITQADDYLTGLQRLMYENDTVNQLSVTQDIDKVTVNPGGDVNLISKVIRYNAAADKFVEAMIYLNQINIISGDGTEGKTICVGKRLDDVSKIEKEPRISRKDTYISVSAWDEGFGAIYSGASDINIQKLLSNKSQIQFFDWEGNPKYLVEVPYQALELDIDFANNVLYVICENNDTMIAYDATDIIRCLRS
ncbi:MAG: hypothetical protein K2L01_02290 [Rikenellaceae bacterium]|nr:hypothetical protein [Rikenellaceae bacterium]